MKSLLLSTLTVIACATGTLADAKAEDQQVFELQVNGSRVFEMRTYYPAQGKFDALHARFREHTCKLFEKHGMTNLGYWVPEGADGGEPRLIYILAHKSRDAAAESWKAFRADPEWIAAKTASEKDGPLLAKPPESVYLKPTDYSKIK